MTSSVKSNDLTQTSAIICTGYLVEAWMPINEPRNIKAYGRMWDCEVPNGFLLVLWVEETVN